MLDFKLAATEDGELGGQSFNLYCSHLKQRSSLQRQMDTKWLRDCGRKQLSTYLSVHLPNPEESGPLMSLRQEIAAAQKKSDEMVQKKNNRLNYSGWYILSVSHESCLLWNIQSGRSSLLEMAPSLPPWRRV